MRIAALVAGSGPVRDSASCMNGMTFITKNCAHQRDKWLNFMFRGCSIKKKEKEKRREM